MNVEQYKRGREAINAKRKELNEADSRLKKLFIQTNKPCDLEDTVRLVSNGGKEYIGKVTSFALYHEQVIISSIRLLQTSKNAFLSKPYRSIEIISKASETTPNTEENEQY